MYFCLPKRDTAIKTLSYIVRFLAGLVLSIALGLVLFTTLPASQKWLAAKVSDILSEELQTKVQIGRARIGILNRVVLDDVLVQDLSEDTLLSATRLSVKISLEDLLDDQIHIVSAQLFGFAIHLTKPSPDEPYNFQFIVDYFTSEDTTSTPLNLALQQVVIRRGRLTHNVLSAPLSAAFTPNHVALEDLRMNFSIDTLTNEHITAHFSELSFRDSRSGLTLQNLRFLLSAQFPKDGDLSLQLSNLILSLPSSRLEIPQLEVLANRTSPSDSPAIKVQSATGTAQGSITPSDLSPLVPTLSTFTDSIWFYTSATLLNNRVRIDEATVNSRILTLNASASVSLPSQETSLNINSDIRQLQVKAPLTLQVLTLLADSGRISPTLSSALERLGDIGLNGRVSYTPEQLHSDLAAETSIGNANVQGDIAHNDVFQVQLTTDHLRPLLLFENPTTLPVDELTLTADLEGSVKNKSIGGTIAGDLLFKTEKIDHFQTELNLTPKDASCRLTLSDDHYNILLNSHLTSEQPLLSGPDVLKTLNGQIRVQDFTIHDSERNYRLDELAIHLDHDGQQQQHLKIAGDFIDAEMKGDYSYQTLATSLQQVLHHSLPSLVPAPTGQSSASTDQMDFKLHVWNSDELFKLFNLDLQLPQAAYIEGSFNGPVGLLDLKLDCPHIIYSDQDLRALSLIAHVDGDSLQTYLSAQRMMESGPLDVSVIANGANDVLNSMVEWNDHNVPVQQGALSTSTRFSRSSSERLNADISFRPTKIVVADTVWNVHPAQVRLADGRVHIHDFQISQEGRHLKVDGRISSNPTDTLFADLAGVELQYVFGIIDFHDVEFSGAATGKVKVSNFSGIPWVDGLLYVPDFTLNGGLLGRLNLDIGFGRKDDRAIDVNGLILEPQANRMSHVVGIIKPGREVGRGMELFVYADHLNTYFINEFTEGIFDRVEGCASGFAHLYGPFSELDLEGEIKVDTISLGIPVLGTRYHTHGGDSVHLQPGLISFHDVRVFDNLHESDQRPHSGIINGNLRFEHFSNMQYDFDITAQDLLGYDFRTFGDQSFCGTAIANGTVSLHGQPGLLQVDITGTPTAGTVFTYNVTKPETMTDNAFITFRKKEVPPPALRDSPPALPEGIDPPPALKDSPPALPVREGAITCEGCSLESLSENLADAQSEHSAPSLTGRAGGESSSSDPMDMYINFNLDITPVAQMRLLMDPRSEDYINLWGNGQIRATFYNKGRFQMYGTYHVDHGNYRLSLQEFIRKEFTFEPGGSITFGGNPMNGDLNLRAIYTVPGVSLNDLSAGSNFSSSSVRVNCLMNIGGRAENPQISFDFDIPNVNEDEKQMIRSLISTDEERNMQVIYLLGIGRFYTYGLNANGAQTNTAMQGLLSSTLSGQLNDILSNAIGSKDWNFGTTFSTGQLGWQDMDVEGSLSGRLLNNRLLINGTFGYRDTPVANTNFIGDFDVRWLLTPSGTVSLKGYSETNDRYFTKSALTTQGVGIQLKKDFNSLGELFRRKK